MDNPVTKVKHYRPYMISKCSKTLRILDFNRIKDCRPRSTDSIVAVIRLSSHCEEPCATSRGSFGANLVCALRSRLSRD